MTRFIIILLFTLLSLSAKADYKILFINTPSISIDGKELKVRDTFAPGATIKWSSPRQAMKVLDMRTGEKLVFMADDFRKAHAASSSDYMSYLAKTRSLSTDGASAQSTFAWLASYLNDRFYLLDSLDIDTGMTTDSRHYFFITYMRGGKEVTKAVPNRNGVFSITPSTLNSGGKSAEVRVKVYYYDKDSDKVSTVCDNMTIVCLPTRL